MENICGIDDGEVTDAWQNKVLQELGGRGGGIDEANGGTLKRRLSIITPDTDLAVVLVVVGSGPQLHWRSQGRVIAEER